jgi:arylsulfatase A-like enzyme
MKFDQKQETTKGSSLLYLFRISFVLSSLYLLREVFNRWDGFSYYAPFSEFVPAVALVSILWTAFALLVTVLLWLIFRLIEYISAAAGLKVKIAHILLFGLTIVLLGALVWKAKRLLWPDVQTSTQLKIILFVGVALSSAYLAWMFRDKAEPWYNIVQFRITPLVWSFGFIVLISFPIVVLASWGKKVDKPVPRKFDRPALSKSYNKRPNIILVIFDTLTAQDMSLYGYSRETTPFISEWAKNATVFTKAEASNNHTSPATASLMTGKRVWSHQVYQQKGSIPVRSDIESLPGELKKYGYYNIAFVANGSASTTRLGIFDSFDIAPLVSEFYRPDNIVFFDPYQYGRVDILLYNIFGEKIRLHDWILGTKLLGLLEPIISKFSHNSETAVPPEVAFNKFLKIYDNIPEPFFAWIHVLPPHAHYLPPKPYLGMFGSTRPAERYMGNKDFNMEEERTRYDEFIRYCDKQYEEFITKLEKIEKSKNTTVIFSSDHGESFQHGFFQHAVPALYEQLTNVPLIIKEPGNQYGKVIHDTVEQIDIPATILDLAHIPVPGWMEGRSLVPYMRGETLLPKNAFSMYFQTNPSRGHEIYRGLIADWEGDYKLIYHLENEKSLLFNLKEDPEELENLFDNEPVTGKHMLDLIKTNLKRANERIRLNNPS